MRGRAGMTLPIAATPSRPFDSQLCMCCRPTAVETDRQALIAKRRLGDKSSTVRFGRTKLGGECLLSNVIALSLDRFRQLWRGHEVHNNTIGNIEFGRLSP